MQTTTDAAAALVAYNTLEAKARAWCARNTHGDAARVGDVLLVRLLGWISHHKIVGVLGTRVTYSMDHTFFTLDVAQVAEGAAVVLKQPQGLDHWLDEWDVTWGAGCRATCHTWECVERVVEAQGGPAAVTVLRRCIARNANGSTYKSIGWPAVGGCLPAREVR